MLLSKQQKAV